MAKGQKVGIGNARVECLLFIAIMAGSSVLGSICWLAVGGAVYVTNLIIELIAKRPAWELTFFYIAAFVSIGFVMHG